MTWPREVFLVCYVVHLEQKPSQQHERDVWLADQTPPPTEGKLRAVYLPPPPSKNQKLKTVLLWIRVTRRKPKSTLGLTPSHLR
jgi:hypothetical protein